MIRYLRRISGERHRRALKRRRTEEIMGWICVPLILILGWYAWKGWEHIIAERQPQFLDGAAPVTIGSETQRR